MNISPDWISAGASVVAAVGVFFAFLQLRVSKNIAQLQFEDSLAKEYRDLISSIPTAALLGKELDEDEYQSAFDEFYHYMDLSNEQVFLRQRKRISKDVWQSWSLGMQGNLKLPAFRRAWIEIKDQSESFQELRRLESENFKVDPGTWSSL